jgi:hypothetical protein
MILKWPCCSNYTTQVTLEPGLKFGHSWNTLLTTDESTPTPDDEIPNVDEMV